MEVPAEAVNRCAGSTSPWRRWRRLGKEVEIPLRVEFCRCAATIGWQDFSTFAWRFGVPASRPSPSFDLLTSPAGPSLPLAQLGVSA